MKSFTVVSGANIVSGPFGRGTMSLKTTVVSNSVSVLVATRYGLWDHMLRPGTGDYRSDTSTRYGTRRIPGFSVSGRDTQDKSPSLLWSGHF